MSMYLNPEQKAKGQADFQEAVGRHVTRRDFMRGMLAAGAALPLSAAVYYGYKTLQGKPIRVGLIGAGDEGGVLAGFHNPEYMHFIAVADIRPSNMKRIFEGEPAPSPRLGFNRIYGEDARLIQRYDNFRALLENKDIEAVVIALPLHLHAPVAIEAMKAGKHVLCEKLMAWNVTQCKDMIKAAEQYNRVLTIGHQRHYSLLYAHAFELLKAGELGEVKHIRALWHRNNTWPRLDPKGKETRDERDLLVRRDGWRPPLNEEDRKALEEKVRRLGYRNMEELVRWRLFNRTGGGLMAELGSHQLDACSIFLNKVHPLAVQGVGTRSFYRDQYTATPPAREVNDHVFATFEFPGPAYYHRDQDGQILKDEKGKPQTNDTEDVVVVTYSSVSTNNFEPYGECVMGTQGTLIVEKEETVMLFPDANKKSTTQPTSVTVTTAGGGQPAQTSSGSPGSGPAVAVKSGAGTAGAVSKGYREEMEHFAYCVRMLEGTKDPKEQAHWRVEVPRCHGTVALADAIIALTANLAMEKRQRIEFKEEWFDPRSSAVPDTDKKAEIIT